MSNKKNNQSDFVKFLFHLVETAINTEFAREKNLFLTCFAHRKLVLWKSCGLDLPLKTAAEKLAGINLAVLNKTRRALINSN